MNVCVTTKQTGINIASQWIHHIANIVVKFFLIAYVISAVGEEHYGGWASIVSIIGYLTLLDAGMSFALQHHIARSSAMGEKVDMASTFSAAHVIYGTGAVLAFVICLLFSALYPSIFPKIPSEAAAECVAALRWVAAAMILYMLSMPIQGSLLGLQGHYLWSAIEIISLLFRTGIVVCTFIFLGPSLAYLGVAFFGAALLRFVISRFALKRLEPSICFRLSLITKTSLRQVFSFGSHSTIWTFCGVITRETGPLLAAIFLNATAATYLYVGTRLVQSLGSLITSASAVFVPVASQLQAVQERARLRSALIRGTRLCMLLALSGSVPLILVAREALYYWVGFEDKASYHVVVILTIGWSGYWMFSAAQAMLVGMRVLWPITGMMVFRAVSSMILGIIMAYYWGLLGLTVGLIAPRFVSTCVVVPYLACRHTGTTFKDILKDVLPGPLFVGSILTTTCLAIRYAWKPGNILEFVAQCTILVFVFGLLALWKGLDLESRQVILGKIGVVRLRGPSKDGNKRDIVR